MAATYPTDRHGNCFAENEGTPGTAETPAAGDHIDVEEGAIVIAGTGEHIQRPALRPSTEYPTPGTRIVETRAINIPLVDLKLGAAAASDCEWTVLAETCLLKTVGADVTYEPHPNPMAASAINSCTVTQMWQNGNDFGALGCRLAPRLSKRAGEPPKLVFTGLGGMIAEVSTVGTGSTPDTGVQCAKFNHDGTPFTLGAYAYRVHEFDFDPGIEAIERLDDKQEFARDYPVAIHHPRPPTFTLVCEAFDEAEHALFAAWRAKTALTLVMNLEDVAATRGFQMNGRRGVIFRYPEVVAGVPHTYRVTVTFHYDETGDSSWDWVTS